MANTIDLIVDGMNCQNCARKVRESLGALNEVQQVKVDIESRSVKVVVTDSGENLTTDACIEQLRKSGYKAVPDTAENKKAVAVSAWKHEIWVAIPITVLLFIIEFYSWKETWISKERVMAILAAPVQFWVGASFARGAWRQLRVGQSSMDTLVTLGSGTAYGLSLWGVFNPGVLHHSYFMEAAAIITFVSIGHHIESRMTRKAGESLQSLMRMAPNRAMRVVSGLADQEVAVSELKQGDQIRLSPGSRVPVDGIIAEGGGSVDESILTGESWPVEKSVSSPVYSGTEWRDGRAVLSITATGDKTTLSQIVAVVERAQGSRAAIQRTADKISSYFVPVVLLIALCVAVGFGISGMWELGIIRAASILIVACPCAMGLATPAALMAATSVAAKNGLLIRDAIALEKCGSIQAIFFDKTGTLTVGCPTVTAVITFEKTDQIRDWVGKLCEGSSHPVSRSLIKWSASGAKSEFRSWNEIRGFGIEAQDGDVIFRLGSLSWLKSLAIEAEKDITIPEDLTRVGLAKNNKVVAVFGLEDPVRKESRGLVDVLKKMNLKIGLISGDHESVAQKVAGLLGISKEAVHSQVRPELKAERIKALQSAYSGVAFVGDGINDAPALAQADLGIAVTQATDIARESADVLLLRNDMRLIADVIVLSKKTKRIIYQNFFWAFIYNIIAIPLAATGCLPAVACAVAMGLSDVIVIGNSLRILKFKSLLQLDLKS